jgi:methanogenic corrinoid protein MtbC1
MQKLLEGDTQSSLQLTRKWIQDNKTPEWLYLEILKPAMYEIGRLWQQGLITEAHEHLASSIVTRIMTDIYLDFPKKEKFKGKVLISSAVNEFHELGSWMLSDLLENSGWQVKYLGANVPNQAVIQMVREFQPDYLAISVTMPFNLIHVKTLTEDLEQEFGKNRPQVLAGGYCFNLVEDLWKSVGADGYAENIREGVDLLNHWAKNEN